MRFSDSLDYSNSFMTSNGIKKVVLFMIGDILCAIDIMNVKEILNPLKVIAMPAASKGVRGVADHRNAAITVIDMRILFGAEPNSKVRKKWIIIKMDNNEITALEVDTVMGVSEVNIKDERELSSIGQSSGHPWSKKVYGSETGLIFELDLQIVADALGALKQDD
ncbi:MAG: chemotaxis protein CheW [Deltaproteobacteria bacterium]|nr:chemotaxis protein CheW [Deltaproteobacteria bacterium]